MQRSTAADGHHQRIRRIGISGRLQGLVQLRIVESEIQTLGTTGKFAAQGDDLFPEGFIFTTAKDASSPIAVQRQKHAALVHR